MKQNLMVYSATRGVVDGNPYSSVWAESEELINKPDTIGKAPMKINCNPDLIDVLRGHLPALVVVELKMISAAGAKGGLYVSAVSIPAQPSLSALKS